MFNLLISTVLQWLISSVYSLSTSKYLFEGNNKDIGKMSMSIVSVTLLLTTNRYLQYIHLHSTSYQYLHLHQQYLHLGSTKTYTDNTYNVLRFEDTSKTDFWNVIRCSTLCLWVGYFIHFKFTQMMWFLIQLKK